MNASDVIKIVSKHFGTTPDHVLNCKDDLAVEVKQYSAYIAHNVLKIPLNRMVKDFNYTGHSTFVNNLAKFDDKIYTEQQTRIRLEYLSELTRRCNRMNIHKLYKILDNIQV